MRRGQRPHETKAAVNKPQSQGTSRVVDTPYGPAAVTVVNEEGIFVWRVQFQNGAFRTADLIHDGDGDLESSCICPPACPHIAVVHALLGTVPRKEKR